MSGRTKEKKMTEFETVKLSFLPGFPDVSIYCKTKEEGKVSQVFEEEQKVSEGKEPKGEQEPPLAIYWAPTMLQMLSVTSTLALSQKAEKQSVISKPQYNPPGSLYCSRVREEETETWRSYINSPEWYSNDNNENDWKLTVSSTTADCQTSALPFYNKPCWYAC